MNKTQSRKVPAHPDLQHIQGLRWDLEQLARISESTALRRDRWIVKLVGEGVSIRDLAIAADLSEGRVYQILRAGPGSITGSVDGRESRLVQLDEDGQEWLAFVLDEDEEGYDVTEERL